MRSIIVVFSDDMVAPLANLRRCLLRYCVDPKQNGVVILCRGYAASDSDCIGRNMMAHHFHVASKITPSPCYECSARCRSTGPTESATTKPTSVKRAFLYGNAVFLERLCTDVSICECPCQA